MKSHKKRKELFKLVDKQHQESRKVLDFIKKGVGMEDPAYKAYQSTVVACKQVKKQFNDILSKGKVLEGFNPENLKE